MATNKYLIAITLIISSFLLLGCQTDGVSPTTSQPTSQPSDAVTTPSDGAELPPASDITKIPVIEPSDHPEQPPTDVTSDLTPEEAAAEEAIKLTSAEDKDIMGAALGTADVSLCDQIQDEELKKSCKTNVSQAQPLEEEVVESDIGEVDG